MTPKPDPRVPLPSPTHGLQNPLPAAACAGFLTHKYLLVAILECLQALQPRRTMTPKAEPQDSGSARPWIREPSARREYTPCIVMREHLHRGELSVARPALEQIALDNTPLAEWMRQALPTNHEPDRDTLHLALAPTLPGVPILVHTIGPQGGAFTHMYVEGVWTVCSNDEFLQRAIRHARLVAHVVPIGSAHDTVDASHPPLINGTPQAAEADDEEPCDLEAMGRVFDHIAVHAAISELRAFRRSRQHPRIAPPGQAAG